MTTPTFGQPHSGLVENEEQYCAKPKAEQLALMNTMVDTLGFVPHQGSTTEGSSTTEGQQTELKSPPGNAATARDQGHGSRNGSAFSRLGLIWQGMGRNWLTHQNDAHQDWQNHLWERAYSLADGVVKAIFEATERDIPSEERRSLKGPITDWGRNTWCPQNTKLYCEGAQETLKAVEQMQREYADDAKATQALQVAEGLARDLVNHAGYVSARVKDENRKAAEARKKAA